jgi:hypothetical protein
VKILIDMNLTPDSCGAFPSGRPEAAFSRNLKMDARREEE